MILQCRLTRLNQKMGQLERYGKEKPALYNNCTMVFTTYEQYSPDILISLISISSRVRRILFLRIDPSAASTTSSQNPNQVSQHHTDKCSVILPSATRPQYTHPSRRANSQRALPNSPRSHPIFAPTPNPPPTKLDLSQPPAHEQSSQIPRRKTPGFPAWERRVPRCKPTIRVDDVTHDDTAASLGRRWFWDVRIFHRA